MVFAIVWQKRACAAAVVLAAAAASVAGVTAAAGAQSSGRHGIGGPESAATATLRQVSYRGYVFRIPAGWPVINLAARPSTCVRFDRHALYLGQPGQVQACPTGLVGSTEAVLAAPGPVVPAGGQAASEDPVAHRIVVTAPRISVTASYLSDRAQILAILKSAGLPAPLVQSPAEIQMGSLSAAPSAVAASATSFTGLGFDTCAAPAASAMSAWRAHSRYRAIGIYIGGSDRACAQQYLTASWVRKEAAAGWHFIPLYVGPQVSFPGEVTAPASQAISAAQDAAVQARLLGFGPGTPVYYDMEAYLPGQSQAALKFFSAWATELHSLGYRSAIYSSSDSGVSDLVANYTNPAVARPDVIYDALWNGIASTSDTNIPATDWAAHQRVHQFAGNVTERHGGYWMNIDQDYMDVQAGGGSGGGGSGGGGSGGGGSAPANGRPSRQASQAVSTAGRVVYDFYAGGDGALWYTVYRPRHGWATPSRLGGALASEPTAVTTANGVMVLFRDANRRLQCVTSGRTGWSGVQTLSMGLLGSAPRAVSTETGGVDVFWRGLNNRQLWTAEYTPGGGWQRPRKLADGLGSQPSPAVSGVRRVSVFWKGTDGRLWHMSRRADHSWRRPAALAMGPIGSAPHATGQHTGEINVFWGGATPGSIWHGVFTWGSRWGTPQHAGSGRYGQLLVIGSAPSTESAFWQGRGGKLIRSTSQGGGWGAAVPMPLGRIGSKLAAVGQSNGVVDVFWKGPGHHLWHSRYYPRTASWTRPRDLGGRVR